MSHRRRLPADLRCRRDNRKGRNDLLHAGWNTQRDFQMSADSKIIPAVSFKTAQTGASAKSDELGMRPMQAQAYEKRGEQRSEERRVGKEWGSACSTRWSPTH